jgi:hypothetical protein
MIAPRSIACVLLLQLATVAPAPAAERILAFVSDVVVERDGDLEVTETIRVQAEGREIRHGILRDFPTIYRNPDGARVVAGFDVRSVTRDGAMETFATESLANGVRLRIGQADHTLATGVHEYVIRYRATRQIGFFSDFDELTWNATGTGWTFAIDTAEARITLPERAPFRQSAVYTGPQGARGKDASVAAEAPGRIVFRTTRPLPPRNGLTVAAAWQKGIVEPPSGLRRAQWWLYDNLALPVAGLGLLILLGFYSYAWLRVGRDPPRGTIIPRFGPPDGMSAAGVRYVNRMAFDNRCFTAAIIELGVNGHLRITGTGSNAVIESRAGGAQIGPAEGALAGKLFATKPSLRLDKVNHEPLGKARDALNAVLSKTYTGKLFTNNFGWSGLGLAGSILVVALIAFAIFLTNETDRAVGLIACMVVAAIPIMIAAAMISNAWRRGARWLFLAGVLLAALAALIGYFVMWSIGGSHLTALPGVAAYALAPLAVWGFHWLQAPTKAGREVMDQIEGLKDYLGVAEEARLEALNPPDKTPELFERFLPYAIALDVENTWARRFVGVLAAASAGAAAGVASSWYAGGVTDNDPVALVDHLGSEFSATVASASTPPGSDSGSGGGGSSDSGGGGGGGSGW